MAVTLTVKKSYAAEGKTNMGDVIRHRGSVFENKGRFQAGDKVLFTNGLGVSSEREVRGVKFVTMRSGIIVEHVWISGMKSMTNVNCLELLERPEAIKADQD